VSAIAVQGARVEKSTEGNVGSRIGFIDAVRGLSALIVMFSHYIQGSHLNDPDSLAKNFINFGQSGVLSFFIVSGFIIPFSLEKYASLQKFFVNRIFRIYPMYLFSIIVAYIVFDYAISGNSHNIFLIVVSYVLMIQGYAIGSNLGSGAWTIQIEMIWYVAFGIIFSLSLNRRSLLLVACVVTFSATTAALSLADIARVPMGRVGFLVVCIWGLLLYRRASQTISRTEIAWMSIILLAVILCDLTVGFYLRPGSGPDVLSYGCVLASWSVGAIVFCIPYLTRHSRIWSHGIFSFFGRISYSLYLLHVVIFHETGKFIFDLLIKIPISFFITILISYITYRYIERPAIIFSHRFAQTALAPARA
jgi:peptidoglycan/LPS O-acetylase OafA/YrhL